jgi:hypothetical protein
MSEKVEYTKRFTYFSQVLWVDVGDGGSVRFRIGDHNVQLSPEEFASIKERPSPTPKVDGESGTEGPISEATRMAREVCPNWMSPMGNAHYRDVLAALEVLEKDRNRILALLHDATCELSSRTPTTKG